MPWLYYPHCHTLAAWFTFGLVLVHGSATTPRILTRLQLPALPAVATVCLTTVLALAFTCRSGSPDWLRLVYTVYHLGGCLPPRCPDALPVVATCRPFFAVWFCYATLPTPLRFWIVYPVHCPFTWFRAVLVPTLVHDTQFLVVPHTCRTHPFYLLVGLVVYGLRLPLPFYAVTPLPRTRFACHSLPRLRYRTPFPITTCPVLRALHYTPGAAPQRVGPHRALNADVGADTRFTDCTVRIHWITATHLAHYLRLLFALPHHRIRRCSPVLRFWIFLPPYPRTDWTLQDYYAGYHATFWLDAIPAVTDRYVPVPLIPSCLVTACPTAAATTPYTHYGLPDTRCRGLPYTARVGLALPGSTRGCGSSYPAFTHY